MKHTTLARARVFSSGRTDNIDKVANVKFVNQHLYPKRPFSSQYHERLDAIQIHKLRELSSPISSSSLFE